MRHLYAASLLLAFVAGSSPTGQEQALVRPSMPPESPAEWSLQAQWARLPFDTIILERTGGCHGPCPVYKVMLHRGVLHVPDRRTFDDEFGRAELQVHRAAQRASPLAAFPESAGDFEGRVHLSAFARLSQLIQSSGF